LFFNNVSSKKLIILDNLDLSSVIIIIFFPFLYSVIQNFKNSEILLLFSVTIYFGIYKGFELKSYTLLNEDLV